MTAASNAKAEESPTRPATPQHISSTRPGPHVSHAFMHPIVCLHLILRHPPRSMRDSDCWKSRCRSVVARSSKSRRGGSKKTVSFLVDIPLHTRLREFPKVDSVDLGGARWPMRTTNHEVHLRSRASPPLLQFLHRRVRLPSVFDQNHGVADPGHERGIKPSPLPPSLLSPSPLISSPQLSFSLRAFRYLCLTSLLSWYRISKTSPRNPKIKSRYTLNETCLAAQKHHNHVYLCCPSSNTS